MLALHDPAIADHTHRLTRNLIPRLPADEVEAAIAAVTVHEIVTETAAPAKTHTTPTMSTTHRAEGATKDARSAMATNPKDTSQKATSPTGGAETTTMIVETAEEIATVETSTEMTAAMTGTMICSPPATGNTMTEIAEIVTVTTIATAMATAVGATER